MPASFDGPGRPRRIVLVGGGHAHALVLRTWARGDAPTAEVILVSPAPTTPYSGMLPGHLAGHYTRGAFHIDLTGLARRAGASFVVDRCVGLDLDAGRVLLERSAPLAFDAASLDVGATSELPPVPGSDRHVVPVKPMDAFLGAWDRLRAEPAPVAVVGGGVGGCELALAIAHRLGGEVALTLIERDRLVSELPERARVILAQAMNVAGIKIITGQTATAFAADRIELADGSSVRADVTIAAAGAQPVPWLEATGLALSADGFVRVSPDLRSVSHPQIFAVGDVAHLDQAPRPKAGVFAVRQGPVLARLLAGDAVSHRPTYEPQADYLRLISLGSRRALACGYGHVRGGTGPIGALLWRLKDRIDRRFMQSLARHL